MNRKDIFLICYLIATTGVFEKVTFFWLQYKLKSREIQQGIFFLESSVAKWFR